MKDRNHICKIGVGTVFSFKSFHRHSLPVITNGVHYTIQDEAHSIVRVRSQALALLIKIPGTRHNFKFLAEFILYTNYS